MQRFWLVPPVIAGLFATTVSGCAIIGPTCVARQQSGSVATLHGEVGAAQIVSHEVEYDTRGSQNTADLMWGDYRSSTPPQVRFHATGIECQHFQLPPASNTGACKVLATAGWTPIGPATNLIVTHGRGNPEVLGASARYRIWVAGDAERTTRYTMSITWFSGPDC